MRHPWILVLAALLPACAPVDMAEHDPHQRHAVQVDSGDAQAVIARPAEGAALSASDAAVLRDLAAEYQRRAAGPVAIVVAKDDIAFADTLAAALTEQGVPATRIAIAAPSDDKAGDKAGSALVRVPVWIARVPECGTFPDRINPDYRNETSTNFGCAVTRNIGLMLSNPADMARARDATGRDANRSVDVLTKYGQGKPTAATAEAPAPAAAFSVVGQQK